MTRLLLLCVVVLLATVPAVANDAKDFVLSPGSETLNLAGAVLDFTKDIVGAPDGIELGEINGDLANGLFLAVDKDWTIGTGIPQIPKVDAVVLLGATFLVDGTEASSFQPIGGVAVALTNIKGGQLLGGIKLVSSDISERDVDFGWLGRYHYAPALTYRVPLGE